MSQADTLAPVTMSASAARRVTEILKRESSGSVLRVAVNGGGCSGFSYAFEIAQDQSAEDVVIARDAATIVIDPVSMDYLKGSEIDFVDDLIGQSFKIHNPNATASCGCGTSFSV